MKKLKFLLSVLVSAMFITPVFAYTPPSTNDTNRTNGWAHVDEVNKDIGEVTLHFIQPRNFFSCFEYRTDGDTTQFINEIHPLETFGVVPEGDPLQKYLSYCLSTIDDRTETIKADEYVEVRMIYGAEGDERFDWTRFNVLPNPDLDGDGVLNEEDRCKDTGVDNWFSDGVLGTNRWQVMKDSDGNLSWYQNKPAKKGIKEPVPVYPLSYTYGCNGNQILNMLTEKLGENAMNGHQKFGLSTSVLEDFAKDLNDGELDGLYFLENVIVPSNNSRGVDSIAVLQDDVEYILKASGEFTYNSANDWADAECYLKNGQVVRGDTEGSKPYVLDVSINGYSINRDWGECNPNHDYTLTFIGEGDVAHFSIYDSASTDNKGTITVKMYGQL